VRPLTDRPTPCWLLGLAALVLAGAAALAYRNGLHAPLVFDDTMSVERNESIRHLWPLTAIFRPPFDTSVTGRPVLNLSFALSYAAGRGDVRDHHLGNVAIHILAGLVLFGLVRRTLARWTALSPPRSGDRGVPGLADDGLLFAFAVALLWLLHPLQTESVTYVIQRAESLMGLFYLLTLYCFIRYAEAGRLFWAAGAVLACTLGMATKEVMATVPAIVLLYDRTFVAGSFVEAWRRRGRLHAWLWASLVVVFALVFGTKGRNGTVGFGIGVRWWDYALTQFPAIARYLRLSFWPRGLVFDYGAQWVPHPAAVLPAALLVAALVGATLWALWRAPAWGFLGAWFFAILAPTSLVPGNRQTTAEHRMYLALIPVLVIAVLGLYEVATAWARDAAGRRRTMLVLTLGLGAVLGAATARRNEAYQTNFSLWADTVLKNPGNYFARNNLGNYLLEQGKIDASLAQYDEALRLNPDFPEGHNNHGTALAHEGRLEDAKAEYRAAIRLKKEYYPDAHNNLGVALAREGDQQGALREFEEILRAKPEYPEVRFNYGNALVKLGRTAEAVAAYQEALRRGLNIPQLHNNYGNVLAEEGRTAEALAQYVTAVQLNPNYAEGYNNLGTALMRAHRLPEAIRNYQQSIWLHPRATDVRLNLANALAKANRFAEAETQYREILQMQPNSVEALNNLGDVLEQDNQLVEAVEQYQTALQLAFNLPEIHNNLGAAFVRLKRWDDALKEFEIALQLKPGYPSAVDNLQRLRAAMPPRRPRGLPGRGF
jgi:protein O-mannosyl-transferase